MNSDSELIPVSGDCLWHSDFLDDIDIHLLYAERRLLPAGSWDFGFLPNDYWRLYYNDSPGGILTFGTKSIDLIPDVVYLIPSRLFISSKNTRDMGHFFVHFDLRGIHPFTHRDLFPEPARVDAGADLHSLLNHVRSKVGIVGAVEAASVQCLIKAAVYAAFGSYLEHLPSDLLKSTWALFDAVQPVKPALQLIERHFAQNLNNRELASACAMSQNYFIRRFREAVGVTPTAYIQQKRLASAAQLLLYSDLTIDAIAVNTGFADRFYFSRVFSRSMGRPPAAYRRQPRV